MTFLVRVEPPTRRRKPARRRIARIAGFVVMLAGPSAFARDLPPTVLACVTETEPGARLACFDRTVAPFVQRSPAADDSVVPPAPPRPAVVESPKPARHYSAHIKSITGSADNLVVALDNGQTWEQVHEASGSMNLHVGDAVDVELSLGSYWLSGRAQTVMQVRRKE